MKPEGQKQRFMCQYLQTEAADKGCAGKICAGKRCILQIKFFSRASLYRGIGLCYNNCKIRMLRICCALRCNILP